MPAYKAKATTKKKASKKKKVKYSPDKSKSPIWEKSSVPASGTWRGRSTRGKGVSKWERDFYGKTPKTEKGAKKKLKSELSRLRGMGTQRTKASKAQEKRLETELSRLKDSKVLRKRTAEMGKTAEKKGTWVRPKATKPKPQGPPRPPSTSKKKTTPKPKPKGVRPHGLTAPTATAKSQTAPKGGEYTGPGSAGTPPKTKPKTRTGDKARRAIQRTARSAGPGIRAPGGTRGLPKPTEKKAATQKTAQKTVKKTATQKRKFGEKPKYERTPGPTKTQKRKDQHKAILAKQRAAAAKKKTPQSRLRKYKYEEGGAGYEKPKYERTPGPKKKATKKKATKKKATKKKTTKKTPGKRYSGAVRKGKLTPAEAAWARKYERGQISLAALRKAIGR